SDDTSEVKEGSDCEFPDSNDLPQGEEESVRRISVSRSRRRNLQNYHQTNGNRNLKLASPESPKIHAKDKTSHVKVRELESRELELFTSYVEDNDPYMGLYRMSSVEPRNSVPVVCL
ncbi:unnamed protein product, partial [Allacma fusca]